MIGRLAATVVLLAMAFVAFWDNPLDGGYSIGFMCLFFAVVAWWKWEIIRGGFYTARGETDLPIIRLTSKIIAGMFSPHNPPARRSSSN